MSSSSSARRFYLFYTPSSPLYIYLLWCLSQHKQTRYRGLIFTSANAVKAVELALLRLQSALPPSKRHRSNASPAAAAATDGTVVDSSNPAAAPQSREVTLLDKWHATPKRTYALGGTVDSVMPTPSFYLVWRYRSSTFFSSFC